MILVGYPSSDFPPPPKFSVRIPDGWQAAWPAGTLLAAHGPASEGGVAPNVLVAHQRLPADSNLEEVVAVAMELIKQSSPPREVEAPLPLEIGGALDAILIAASFTNQDGVRVLQRQILLQVAAAGKSSAILEVTATCDASDLEEMREIIGSFEFAPVVNGESLLPDTIS